MASENLRLEVGLYLDISCPWCYLAHKRFTSALTSLETAALPQTLTPDRVRIRVHPFFVNHKQRLLEDGSERPTDRGPSPEPAPKLTDPFEEEERKEKAGRLKELAAQDGLVIRPPKGSGDTSAPSSSSNPRQLPNTTAAHRLLRWIQASEDGYTFPVAEEGPKLGAENGWNRQRDETGPYEARLPYKALEELFKVQFELGGNLEDTETLVSAFSRVPDIPQSALDAARAFLQTPSYRTSILTTEHLGREELGVTGVPWYRFSVVDLNLPNDAPEEERVLISFELVGAQDAENFARLVGRAMMKGRERMGRKYGK